MNRSRRWLNINLRGLRVQIVLWSILPFTLLLVALSLTGIRSHQLSMRHMVSDRDSALAQALADEVSTLLAHYRSDVQLLASAGGLTAHDGPANQEILNAAGAHVGDMTLVVLDRDGKLVTGPDGVPPWYAATVALLRSTPAPAAQPVSVGSGDATFLLWIASLDGGSGWVVGGVPLASLPLGGTLDPHYLGSQGSTALVDQGGKLLFVQGTPAVFDSGLLPSNLAPGASGVRFVPGSQGEQVVAYAPVSAAGWRVVVSEPWEPLVAPLLSLNRLLPFVLLAAGLASLLTLFFGLRYVVRPLQKLEVQAERIGAGEFDAASEPVGGVKEVEELRRTLDDMACQVERYQAALEDYLSALTQAQEEERARMARELHDETVQSLIALGQRAQMVQHALAKDPQRAAERLEELREMIGEALEEVRRFTRALRPLYLEELGLVPALEMLAREAGAEFHVSGMARRLEPEQELTLYRVAQEALSNALRHAGAGRIHVELVFSDAPTAVLRVRDDGAGFDVPQRLADMARQGHFGLLGMHERAQRAGGHLSVEAAPGQGTTVEVCLPCGG